ncbi:MAG: M20/M25/M40 family metallo-hydrolase [Lachnospiraceae bacterium]|nr:M20/M25/M40 family metallo-hydrolase [Lachnospiraceae bacterium]
MEEKKIRRFDALTCAKHLAGMIHFQTVSDADHGKMDFQEFEKLHAYMEQTFPLVHQTLSREIIGKAGLLYHWKGTGKSNLEPVMLIAHQDVVPAGDESRWTYPPYEGTIADGHIWGRGANDCKCIMLAHFEAIEALIADGFVPDYDVYLGYGYDEEVGGSSAVEICQELLKRGIHLGMLIDEGSGVCPGEREGMSDSLVSVKLAEKGSGSYKITVHGKGGHTMNAGPKSIIAQAGQIALDLQNNPFPWHMSDCAELEFASKAPYCLKEENRQIFADPDSHLAELTALLEHNPRENGKLRSTMVLTGIRSFPENAVPTEVELKVSSRILEGDTPQSLADALRQIVGDRAEVELVRGEAPSPTSRIDTPAYQCVKETYEALYPGVHVIPSLGVGGTDARHYYPVCDCVYRCSGYPYSSDGISINLHDFDENMELKNLGRGPEFFAYLLTHYGECLD